MAIRVVKLNEDSSWMWESDSLSILVDPWFTVSQIDLAPWFSEQFHLNPQPLISEIKKPHYIFISHPFTDHCNKETLLQFDPTIPIIAETNTLTKIKRWNYFKNLININDFEKVKIERINKKLLFDLVHNAFLISFENKKIVYAPHGFKSLNKYVTADVLITSCSTYHLPWYLGGTINLGINKALSMAELLSTSIILSTHDEQKIGKGIVEKIAKKIPVQENKKIIILERGRELIIE